MSKLKDSMFSTVFKGWELLIHVYPRFTTAQVDQALKDDQARVEGNEIIGAFPMGIIVERKPAEAVKGEAVAAPAPLEAPKERSTHLYHSLMSLRICMSVLVVGMLTHDLKLVTCATFIAYVLHHFRTFDTDYRPWTGWQKFFNFLLGVGAVGTMLFGAGEPWLQPWLLVTLGILFGFIGPMTLSYLVNRPGKAEYEKEQARIQEMIERYKRYR